MYLTRPSELLAGLKVPSELIKAVAGMPLDLLQFKIDVHNKYRDYFQAQIDHLKKEQEWLKEQQTR